MFDDFGEYETYENDLENWEDEQIFQDEMLDREYENEITEYEAETPLGQAYGDGFDY